MTENSGNILIVDDERELVDFYAESLESDFDVRTAYSGEGAMEELSVEPDVVLLDRRLPDMSGDEILEAIQRRKLDTSVAMLTAVDPDFDIIDSKFDDYLTKPIQGEKLQETVERLLTIDDIHDKKRELSAKQVKRNVLEVEKRPEELAESDDFQRLKTQIERLKGEIATLESQLETEDSVDSALDLD